MSLAYPLLQPSLLPSVKLDSQFTKRFPDLLQWLDTCSKQTVLGDPQDREVLLQNPNHIGNEDVYHYGWHGHQDGCMFTVGGDHVRFLFRDGVVYTTFSGILMASTPDMYLSRGWNNTSLFKVGYHPMDRGFIDAGNFNHQKLLDRWLYAYEELSTVDRIAMRWASAILPRK